MRKILDYLFLLDLNDDLTKKAIMEQITTFIFIYGAMNFIAWSTIVELIWPTHFFNRRHTSSSEFLRFRTYTETILKIVAYNSHFFILNLHYFHQKLILKN